MPKGETHSRRTQIGQVCLLGCVAATSREGWTNARVPLTWAQTLTFHPPWPRLHLGPLPASGPVPSHACHGSTSTWGLPMASGLGLAALSWPALTWLA